MFSDLFYTSKVESKGADRTWDNETRYNQFSQNLLPRLIATSNSLKVETLENEFLRSKFETLPDPLFEKFIDPRNALVLAEIDAVYDVTSVLDCNLDCNVDQLIVPPARTRVFVHCSGGQTNVGFFEYVLAKHGYYCHGLLIPADDRYKLGILSEDWPKYNTGLYYPQHSRLLPGKNGLSDIRISANIEWYQARIKEYVHGSHVCHGPHGSYGPALFLADVSGSKDKDQYQTMYAFTETGESNETRHMRWLTASFELASRILRRGGNAVFKLYTCLLPRTVQLVFLISTLFNRVAICRPRGCPLATTECYLVCLGFKAEDDCSVFAHLLESGTDPFEPLSLDYAQVADFADKFLVPWSVKLCEHWIRTCALIQKDDAAALSQLLPDFPPARLKDLSELFVYARPALLAAPASGPQTAGFLQELCSLLDPAGDTYLLVSLVGPERDFVFCSQAGVFEIQTPQARTYDQDSNGLDRPDGVAGLAEYKRDLAALMAPGMVLEIKIQSPDLLNLRVVRLVATAERPLIYRTYQDQHLDHSRSGLVERLISYLPLESILKVSSSA